MFDSLDDTVWGGVHVNFVKWTGQSDAAFGVRGGGVTEEVVIDFDNGGAQTTQFANCQAPDGKTFGAKEWWETYAALIICSRSG